MTVEEAIKVAAEMNEWRRREDDMPAPMPHAPREFGKAIDTLIEHAKRTTWQPIETLTGDAGDIIVFDPYDTLKPILWLRNTAGKWRDADGWNYPLDFIKKDHTHWMHARETPEDVKQ